MGRSQPPPDVPPAQQLGNKSGREADVGRLSFTAGQGQAATLIIAVVDTPESLQAKESVHVLYERLRRPDVTAAEREEVCRAMDATFSSLETPVDVLTARR